MLKSKIKKVFVTALAASVVMGCFTVTAFAMPNPTSIITYPSVGVQYSAHVQDIGWMPFVSDGQTAGTTGRSLRMEALTANLTNVSAGARISYSVYVQDKGWMPAVSDGETAGTVGQSKRIEAVKINLNGLPGYSVEYRVHVQNIGWMAWQKDGAVAGTTAQSLRLEAIEIRVVAPQLPVTTVIIPQTIDITSAGVTGFIAPAVEQAPQLFASLLPNSEEYAVTNLIWSPFPEPVFGWEQVYTATVVLTSAPGYKFPAAGIASPAADVGIVVTAGTTSGGDVSGNTLTFQVSFPPTFMPYV